MVNTKMNTKKKCNKRSPVLTHRTSENIIFAKIFTKPSMWVLCMIVGTTKLVKLGLITWFHIWL